MSHTTGLRGRTTRAWRAAAVALLLLLATLPSAAGAATNDAVVVWDAVSQYFPANQVAFAVRVARCESGFNPWAEASGYDSYYGYYRYVGLFQIEPSLHQWRANRLFGPGASLYDPYVNAAVAADILRESGWGAWPYCSRHV